MHREHRDAGHARPSPKGPSFAGMVEALERQKGRPRPVVMLDSCPFRGPAWPTPPNTPRALAFHRLLRQPARSSAPRHRAPQMARWAVNLGSFLDETEAADLKHHGFTNLVILARRPENNESGPWDTSKGPALWNLQFSRSALGGTAEPTHRITAARWSHGRELDRLCGKARFGQRTAGGTTALQHNATPWWENARLVARAVFFGFRAKSGCRRALGPSPAPWGAPPAQSAPRGRAACKTGSPHNGPAPPNTRSPPQPGSAPRAAPTATPRADRYASPTFETIFTNHSGDESMAGSESEARSNRP